jgi:glycosyltransferase involved in cell wall biosynthesis
VKHYLDVTNTFLFWHGSPTGIQRVIQGLTRATRELPPEQNFELAVFHPGSRRWYSLSTPVMESTFEPDLFVKSNQKLKSFLKASSAQNQSRSFVRQAAEKAFRPLYRRSIHGLGMWMGRQAREHLLKTKGTRIRFEAGDRLYIADGNWGIPEFLPALRQVKIKQPFLDVVGFIYDITPITHPQFIINKDFVGQFSNWISQLLELSSWILTDSKDAANEVLRVYLSECKHHSAPPRAVRFGSKVEGAPDTRDLTASEPSEIVALIDKAGLALTEEQRKSILECETWAMWVGLIHPRKNLDVQINALEPLWKTGSIRMPLFWVGRMGGGCDDLLHRVTQNPYLKSNVIRLEAAPDSLLCSLFKGARFSLYTSWAEGFGLPVSESLQRGCPVIASSWSSIPEVAGELVEYFDPWDARGLQQIALKYLRDPVAYAEAKKRASRYAPFSWKDTLEDFRVSSFQNR